MEDIVQDYFETLQSEFENVHKVRGFRIHPASGQPYETLSPEP